MNCAPSPIFLIFMDITIIALAMYFRAFFSFAAAFQSPRIPAFMDPQCERKLEECSRGSREKTPAAKDLRSCRREEMKVKTAEAVSDQVLLGP